MALYENAMENPALAVAAVFALVFVVGVVSSSMGLF